MAGRSIRRKQPGIIGNSRPSTWMFLMLAGLVLVGLAAGLAFAYGRSPTSDAAAPQPAAAGPQTAAQVIQVVAEEDDLPPLSTQGQPIAGWHDMANIPENFEGKPLPKDQPQPDVVVKPGSRDLGTVGAKDVVNLDYIVVNQGDQDLVIDNVVTSCGCTTAVLTHSIIPPGHRADLAVRFDAGYHEIKPGEEVVRAVWLLTNDPDTPVAEARLTATIQ